MPEETYTKEQDIAVLAQKVIALERESERNQETHKDFLSRLEEINNAKVRTDVQYANIMTKLDKLESAVEELREKPARRWETIVTTALQWIVVAVMAAIAVLK